jgi:hypothetical protein
MTDNLQAYEKADTMNALKGEMEKMVKEQQKMMDPNHKDDSSEENSSSDEEGHQANEFTFKSAIDVGSHFIDVDPHEELKFQQFEGHFITQFAITNPCPGCPIAFFVYTSAPIPVKIFPNCGFIPAKFKQEVKIVWEAQNHPDADKLENSMFFVKALPLSPDMDLKMLSENLQQVFNTYNVNILFTTHNLPSHVSKQVFNPQQMQAMQQRQQALLQQNQKQLVSQQP